MSNQPGRRAQSDDDSFPDEGVDAAQRRRELEALLTGSGVPKDPEPGALVKGVVVQVGPDDLFVDVGAKSEAVISREDLATEEGSVEIKVGDTIEASVVSTSDGIRLSRRLLKSARSRADLEDAFRSGVAVEGRVEGSRKGGFDVALPGSVRAFCPMSQIDERRAEDPQVWVGRTLSFRILELGPGAKNVVLSRRRLLEEESARKSEEARSRLAEGAVMAGKVASLTGYGAFIDLGGIQGLLHVSEIGHTRINHPSEVLQVGGEVKVKILKIDAASGKISLGMKQLLEDPWETVTERVRPGDRREGRVTRVAEFGAFVELVPGIEGLVHVSELCAGRKGADARKLVESGTTMSVKVLEVDTQTRRISLGRIDADIPEEVAIEPGAFVRGKVDRVEPFGVFVRIAPGVVGLVPNEEMATAHGADHRKEFAPGTPLEVQVLAVEEGGRRIRLSRAGALARAERDEVERFGGGGAGSGDGGFSTLGDALRKIGKSDEV